MNKLTIAALSVAATLGMAAQAADLAAGKAKAEQMCAACHAADGNSTVAANPILAGQHADYLKHALKQYQSGQRNNAVMGGIAKSLSAADINNVAAWFASQKSALNMSR